MRTDKKSSHRVDKKASASRHRQGVVGYSKKSALLEEAITHMNTGKYGRSSAALKELLALDPQNTEARRLFATLHLRLGSLVTAREAFESLANEAIGRQDYWLAESLLREYLAAGPRCIPFLELLAHVYEEKGDAMAAVAELGKAIDILLEDPDPDNPKKPSQLYTKIRELAPASSVAFQFASSFDVQTGEFCLPQREVADREPSELQQIPPISTSVSGDVGAPSEIMPWEHLDESPLAGTPSSYPDNSEEIIGIEAATSPSNSSFELTVNELSDPKAAQGNILTTMPEAASAVEAPPFERTEGASIDEPSATRPVPCEPLVEPEHDIAPNTPVSIEPTTVPSRMPWEHVADPTLQIVESEPSPHPPFPPARISLTDTPTSLSATPPAETTLEPPIQNPTDNTAFADGVSVTHRSNPTPDPAAESSVPTGTAPSSATSFTWKEIFDSAWKFTVGTTAPSSSVTTIEPVVPAPMELGPASDTALHLPDGAPTASSAGPQSISHDSPFDSTVEIFLQTNAASSSLLPEQESIGESPSFVVGSQPAPASFSPVVEEQVSPPPAIGEPVHLEPSEPAPPSTITITEPATTINSEAAVAMPAIEASQTEPPPAAQASMAVDSPVDEKTIPPSPEGSGHWDTGEVAVQLHRPTKKKRQWEREPSEVSEGPTSRPDDEPLSEPVSGLSNGWESAREEAAPLAVTEETSPPSVDTRPEWAQASDSIVLDPPTASSTSWRESAAESLYTIDEPPPSPAASAVDVLFGSPGAGEAIRTSDPFAVSKPRPRFAARLARLRIGIMSLILSCFSTTRAFVLMCATLVVLCVVTAAVGVGVITVAWIVMEESPTPHYQNLTNGPQRAVSDQRKNGFLLLLGFAAPAGSDPIQAGYERKMSEQDVSLAQVCMVGHDAKGISGMGASSNVIDGWFKGADPLAQLKAQAETVRSVIAQESTSLARYQQWLTMPFDDWGFGQILSPNCARVLLAHRLFLLEGFNQDTTTGMSRLERDMESWRAALGQSKTLMVKMLAATAVQDDALLASSLLTKPDTDAATVNRLAKVVRPFDQLELSVRWPMQSHFVWSTRNVTAELKKDRTEERPFHVSIAATMPLPVQRRANAYAEYYEAANRAVAEGRYVNLPKLSQFIRSSPSSLLDYLVNPIEHIIGIDPLPSWDPFVNRMIETDAQLRLASLQVWVRRGSQDGDVLARLAKAGQAYYDPFTGLPMLVNQSKRVLYSVGRDGKDQEGDRRLDVVVAIPSPGLESKRSSK